MIRHAEAGPKMLGQQHDCVFVLVGVLLGEVPHGLDQEALAFNVAGIEGAVLAFAASWVGQNGNSKHFSQECTSRVLGFRCKQSVGQLLINSQATYPAILPRCGSEQPA